jgi:ferrochelatase
MRVAVVLFNLGGPDNLDAVQPFLFNLFNDKAIIGAPGPIRWAIAKLISKTRAPSAKENYAKMGNKSPLLEETQKQAYALEQSLRDTGMDARCFIAMRYWKPFTEDTVKEVEAFGADKVILLPLYPQFSTTTTGSSLEIWEKSGGANAQTVCCYPTEEKFITAHADKIISEWKDKGSPDNLRVLLSAHGLPEKIVKDGDPYQWQVEQTSAAIAAKLPSDWEVETCYQSRVGPLKWIGPSTDDCIEKAGQDKKALMVSPIAFVSEHIETLVELDEEYKELAEEHGVETYLRAPALGITDDYISSLVDLVRDTAMSDQNIRSCAGGRICPNNWKSCPQKMEQVS